jgi:hypothetical protein
VCGQATAIRESTMRSSSSRWSACTVISAVAVPDLASRPQGGRVSHPLSRTRTC